MKTTVERQIEAAEREDPVGMEWARKWVRRQRMDENARIVAALRELLAMCINREDDHVAIYPDNLIRLDTKRSAIGEGSTLRVSLERCVKGARRGDR